MSDLLNQLILQADAEAAKTKSTKRLDYILLDGSGSMSTQWFETLSALDTYMRGICEVDTRVIMATFSGKSYNTVEGDIEYNIVRDNKSANWPALAHEPPILPGGGTPLYDAINVAVRACREENPTECVITIATDGEENGSRTTNETQARALLDWCRARGWQINFIGCDFNNSRLAKALGAGGDTAIGAPTKRLADITGELARKRVYHATHGTPMTWSDAEKQQFGGYLSDQTGAK